MNDRMRVGLLLVVAILVYANTLANGFTYDDQAYILHNPVVQHPSLAGFSHPMEVNNVFRPIYLASFALNWAFGQAQPFGYHLFNVLLQAAVVVLLYLLLKMLLESSGQAGTIAFVTALLFAVHPIHTEAVASIVGRSELLAVGFLLAAWLLHLHDREVPALLCFLLALLSKESAVVFVPLVILGDYARGKLKPVLRYGWIAGLAALYLAGFREIEGGRWGEKRVIFLDNPLASLPATGESSTLFVSPGSMSVSMSIPPLSLAIIPTMQYRCTPTGGTLCPRPRGLSSCSLYGSGRFGLAEANGYVDFFSLSGRLFRDRKCDYFDGNHYG